MDADLIEISDLPTGVVRIELDANGVPAYEIVSPAAYEAIELPDLLGPAIAVGADMIVLGTLAQRFPRVRGATRRIVDANPGAVLLYDVNLRFGCWEAGLVERLLEDATVAKLNEDEQDGWRGRIRTFGLLIQSLYIGIRLASRHLSVRRAAVGHRIGVSQVRTPK